MISTGSAPSKLLWSVVILVLEVHQYQHLKVR